MTVSEWHTAFRACPRIWMVLDPDDNPTNFYESEEAAMCEINSRDKLKHRRRYRVVSHNVHTLALAVERWVKGVG